MTKNLQRDDVREILSGNRDLALFMSAELKCSLSSIGFSEELLTDLLSDLGSLDVRAFGNRWKDELKQKYSVGFFQDLVPQYFLEYVVPVTPPSEKIIDIGCGTGILAKLYAQDERFGKIIGIDIGAYPEWELFGNENIRFEVVQEEGIIDFLKAEKPDSIVLTWTLHHMEYDEQERYLGYIHDALETGAKIVALEDSYSTELPPENGPDQYAEFMKWNAGERAKIMSVYDWVANRVLAQREAVPIPCAYRSLEEWSALLEKKGFKTVRTKFIGFPDNRDIHTPQSLLVAEKIG